MNWATQTKNIKYPTATITVGRFNITYQWHPHAAYCGTAWGWDVDEPDGFDDTPEQDHLEKIKSSLKLEVYRKWATPNLCLESLSHKDEEFMDALVAALEQNPFQPEGESK
jgi:hypothetical protein